LRRGDPLAACSRYATLAALRLEPAGPPGWFAAQFRQPLNGHDGRGDVIAVVSQLADGILNSHAFLF
jgi:hypothetical protein